MTPATRVSPAHVAGPLRLAPFRALRLTASRVGDPGAVRAFARPYHRVQERLQRWEEQGLATRDTLPGLYLHEYTANGITVRGLVGALDVSRRAARPEQRAILPHEGIYPEQADDLADRMAEMGLNPAPILLVQDSPEALRVLLRTLRSTPPDHAFTDRVGQSHRLWTITDRDQLHRIDELLGPTTAVIADGHHRYAAYLRLQQRHPGDATDYGLAMLVDQQDTPLFLGAIHRVLVGCSVSDLIDAAAALGSITTTATQEQAVAALAPGSIVATDTRTWVVMTPDLAEGRLELDFLHQQLIPTLPHGPRTLTYHHLAHQALDQAAAGLGTAVLLAAPTFAQVQRVVLDDRLFPEKATSFQPKPPVGALLRSLRGE